MPIDQTPSEDEIERQKHRHAKHLVRKGKANAFVRYYNGAEAAADAAGIP